MNCEAVSKNAALFLYGELTLEEEQAFQDHIETCEACRRAFEAEKAIHKALDARQAPIPPALLARCRHDFEERLDRMPARGGWFARLGEFGRIWPVLAKPAGAIALIALGFFGARMTPQRPGDTALVKPAVATADPVVTRVRYVEPEQAGQVRMVVEETRQHTVSGDAQDAGIRALLLAAARESSDPGVRADSVQLLQQRAASSEVRDALLNSLRTDSNAGVRLRALDGLKQYAADPEVRHVLAQVLLADDNPGVRTQVIDLLVQHKEDSLVGVLQQSLQKESNVYVRQRSERALKEMNASVGTF